MPGMGPSSETTPREAPVALHEIEYDVRRKRPPVLSFLLRWETARRFGRVASLLALDFAAVFIAIYTALGLKAVVRGLWNQSTVLDTTEQYVSFAFLLTALLFAQSGLYNNRAERPGLSRIVSSLTAVMAVALVYALVNGEDFSSYYIFYGSLFFAVAFVASFRFGYELLTGAILRAAGYARRAVLVGSGEHIENVAQALDQGPSSIHVVGFVSLQPRSSDGLRSLGRFEDLPRLVGEHRIDEVIIADPAFPEQQAVELVDACHQRGVRVRVAPSTMAILVQRAEFVPGESVPLFELKPPVFEGFDYVIKRLFDLVASTLFIVALSPLLATCALLVKLTSRGPVIYRSIRPGIGGVPFACLKFRTMYDDADRRQAELEHHNEATGALFKMRDDPRVTPVGRVLRRFSLDELPQLFNVLRGEMSLVGPRPLPQRDYERLDEWHKKRYLVLPGLTGLWQVSGRADLDFDDLVRLDFLYLERWSVFLDLSIVLKTIPAILLRRGAF
jgi:exopolysaccharide biosynthesis polyprenyl glycosylphosphotransferase